VNIYTHMTSLGPARTTGEAGFTWAETISNLWIRRRLILSMIAAFLCLGAADAFLRTPQYTVKSVAEIGSLPFDNSSAPVETADAVINKIKQVYAESAALLPGFEKELAGLFPATSVRAVRNTNAIIIENIADNRHANALIAFQIKIFELLRADHEKLFHVALADLESQRNQARLEIERLKDPAAIDSETRPIVATLDKLQSDLLALRKDHSSSPQAIALNNAITAAVGKLDDLKDNDGVLLQAIQQKDGLALQLKSQIAHLKAYIEQAQLGREKIAASLPESGARTVEDRTTMMSLLSFDSELNRTTAERDGLEQSLEVTLPLDRAKIESDRAANRRQIGIQENAILKLKADRRTMDQDRADQARALEQSIPGPTAKMADVQQNRKRLVAVQEARVTEITAKLADAGGTRLLVAPRREDAPAGAAASVIVPVSGILGLAAGCLAALALAMMEKFNGQTGFGALKDTEPMQTRTASTPGESVTQSDTMPSPYRPGKREPRDVLRPLLTSFQIRPMPTRKPGSYGWPR
jgi:hypothetical protein